MIYGEFTTKEIDEVLKDLRIEQREEIMEVLGVILRKKRSAAEKEFMKEFDAWHGQRRYGCELCGRLYCHGGCFK